MDKPGKRVDSEEADFYKVDESLSGEKIKGMQPHNVENIAPPNFGSRDNSDVEHNFTGVRRSRSHPINFGLDPNPKNVVQHAENVFTGQNLAPADVKQRSLGEKRGSPSMQVHPFVVEDGSQQNLAGSLGSQLTAIWIDYSQMLNALNVSGVEKEDSMDHQPKINPKTKFVRNEDVNDQMIEDIQNRLKLLDDF